MEFVVEGRKFTNYEEAKEYEESLSSDEAEKAEELLNYLKENAVFIMCDIGNKHKTCIFMGVDTSEDGRKTYLNADIFTRFGVPIKFNTCGIPEIQYFLTEIDERMTELILNEVRDGFLGKKDLLSVLDYDLYFSIFDRACADIKKIKQGTVTKYGDWSELESSGAFNKMNRIMERFGLNAEKR